MTGDVMANGVSFIRNEVNALFQVWFLIRDCIEGETAIKGEFGINASYIRSQSRVRNQAHYYLPKPNPTDTSTVNTKRYEQYVRRAVWYNFTARTLAGLVGQIFLRPPVSVLPSQLDALVKNADGEGMTLEQVGKRTAQSVMAFGRAGLYTDFPAIDGPASPADIKEGNIRPYIRHYYPWQIINWATIEKGANRILSLVVLEEWVMLPIDDFALAERVQYRVLRLDPKSSQYYVEIWANDIAETTKSKRDFSVRSTFTPTDSNGQPLDHIPFTFVGSEANDISIDVPPMQDLAFLNIAHYRNSADYEESCFLVGQPTPVLTGLTEAWVENVLKGSIQLGSRGSISLPVGADAKLLQADPNQMPLEAMKLKEQQALSLGAKLVQASTKVRTATEVSVDKTSESSTLHNVSKNSSAALEQALKWAANYAGASDAEITYQLNSEFDLTRLDAEDLLTVMKIWQSGGICFEEMRDVLKIAGYATLDDKEALTRIQDEQSAPGLAAPIADPFQSKTPTAPENQPGATGEPLPGHIVHGAIA
jgi:hypothetical protein